MPILDAHTIEVFSRSPAQTRRVGMRLGTLLQPGDVVCLSGDLGSGKTTLVQGLAAGWGSLDPVSSPTYILVNMYRHPTGAELFHLDAYRLQSAQEAWDLDIEHWMQRGPLVVEWPERIEASLPAERLWVTLAWMDDEHRTLRFQPVGARYQKLCTTLRQGMFGVM